jgi:transmembrane sensor
MKTNYNAESHLAKLFTKYFDKTASVQETEELFELLQVSTDEELAEVLRVRWDELETEAPALAPEKSKEILSQILKSGNGSDKKSEKLRIKFLSWFRLVSAAAILILVGWLLFIDRKSQPAPESAQISGLKNDILPGGNKALLKMSDGRTIVLSNRKNGIVVKQDGIEINKVKEGQLLFVSKQSPSQKKQVLFNTLETPKGGQYALVLPDGTKVWLNAASSLHFPSTFTGKERLVELKGEAYFEVAKNASMPFKVKTQQGEVKVLGTHFNIMSYEDETVMKTTLLEGAVQIKSGKKSDVLKPGEQAIMGGGGEIKIRNNINVEEEIAWKKGVFQFNDTDIKEVMRQLSRWYDVEIIYKGDVADKQLTGKISRNVKASEVINMLRFMGSNCRIEGKNIVVAN